MQRIKLFFDECCSPRLPRKLKEVASKAYPDFHVRHLTDIFRKGRADARWLAVLQKEKDWIVVTADKGRDPKRAKLPILCRDLRITYISMSAALLRSGYMAHEQALLSCLPDFQKVQMLPKGTKVSLGYRMSKDQKIPWLSIDQKTLDAWCRENGIQLPE